MSAPVVPSEERLADLGDVALCWQQFGADEDPTLLLVMGLGAQLIHWPDELCADLAGRGFRVVRFDNRDSGRSTVLDRLGAPSVGAALAGQLDSVPYTLSEMAADAAGLLDALGIEAAHVAGASLGGMIAQTLAIERPERVLTLASVMSTTGDPEVGGPTPEGMEALTMRPAEDRAGYIEATVRARRLIGSPGFEFDEERFRDLAGRAFERGYHPDGTLRQVVAIVASGDRTDRLRRLRLPTVVIHGTGDPLIAVSGGRATAEAIPGARLIEVEGMGHDFPAETWDCVADAIAENAALSLAGRR